MIEILKSKMIVTANVLLILQTIKDLRRLRSKRRCFENILGGSTC